MLHIKQLAPCFDDDDENDDDCDDDDAVSVHKLSLSRQLVRCHFHAHDSV